MGCVQEFDLCVGGDGLDHIVKEGKMEEAITHVQVTVFLHIAVVLLSNYSYSTNHLNLLLIYQMNNVFFSMYTTLSLFFL